MLSEQVRAKVSLLVNNIEPIRILVVENKQCIKNSAEIPNESCLIKAHTYLSK